MKMMMVAVCAMVAAFAAVADDALPPPRFLGFALGDKVDAAVCKARGLSAPEKVVVDEKGTTYYCCKSAAPTNGYDEVGLVLSFRGKVIRITGILNVSGEAEYERKRQELTAKYRAEFAAYECDRNIGRKEFTIEYDDKHKCAEVVLAYILTSDPASRAYGIYAGR